MKLPEVLNAYGGPLDMSPLPFSVRQTLEGYAMLAGINPTVIPDIKKGGLAVTPPSRFAQVHFVRRWNVNAVTALAEEAPVLVVFGATPFALHIYFRRLLACPEILVEFDGAAERPEGTDLSVDFDYEGLLTGKYPDEIPLTSKDIPEGYALAPGAGYHTGWSHYVGHGPLSKRRAELAIYLANIATFFLISHELEHVDGGHLKFIEPAHGFASLAEFGADGIEMSSRPKDATTAHALEILADARGVRQTYAFAVTSPVTDWLGEDLASLEPLQRTRLWMFAVMALFCLFEARAIKAHRARGRLRIFRPAPTHPSNYVRLTTAIGQIFASLADQPRAQELYRLAWGMTVRDEIRILRRLGLYEAYNKSPVLHDLAPIMRRIQKLGPALEAAKAAIASDYFYRGRRTGSAEGTTADDPFHLKGQHVEFFNEDGTLKARKYFDPPRVEFYESGKLVRTVVPKEE